MGWFDNEKVEKQQAAEPARPGAAPAAPAPAPTPTSSSRAAAGSTLGERVHVNGTIVCEEPLRILGKVEGTIRAREDLAIAKGAEVRAVIHGRRVQVEGHVKGDVHATEVLVLGATAVLEGNIGTPSLQIHEGAFFKGTVEMRTAEPEKAPAKSAPPKSAPPKAQDSGREQTAKTVTPADKKADAGGEPADKPAAPAAVTAGERSGKRG